MLGSITDGFFLLDGAIKENIEVKLVITTTLPRFTQINCPIPQMCPLTSPYQKDITSKYLVTELTTLTPTRYRKNEQSQHTLRKQP
jgi:hypothetical protein